MEIGYIYKITSPKKRVYIGQTVNYEKRFSDYKYLMCKKQPKLYNSFKKHGVDKHKFEVLAECDVSELNKFERYYQDLFHCATANGLNLRLTSAGDRSGRHSEESKEKMRLRRLAVIEQKRTDGTLVWSDQQRERREATRLANPYKATDETKAKQRAVNLGKKHSEETLAKMSASLRGRSTWNKGKSRTEAHSKAYYAAMVGKNTGETCKKSRLILNTETGIYYVGAKAAVEALGRYGHCHLNDMMNGRKKNKTAFIVV